MKKNNLDTSSTSIHHPHCSTPPPPLGGSSWEAEKIKVSLYIRVSTDQQDNEGDSLEEQENELKKYCEFRNFHIHNIFIERGKSAKNTQRPEYQKLLYDIHQQKINAIVVKKLDRLSRSILDFEQLMPTLQPQQIEFISLKENFDTTTAMGKAMVRVALVFAQLEREQTSERITDVMTYRASQGLFNGGIIPFGYTAIDKALAINPAEKKVVDVIFKTMLQERSCWQVAKILNNMSLFNRQQKPWIETSIQRLLKNVIYVGQVVWKGVVYPGIHPPLISQATFDQVQNLLKTNPDIRRKKTDALFQKHLFCGHCKVPMTTTYSLNRKKLRFYYYLCTNMTHGKYRYSHCSVKRIRIQTLEAQVIHTLITLSKPGHFKAIHDRISGHNHAIDDKLTTLTNRLTTLTKGMEECKDKQDKFLDALIDGKLSSKERQLIMGRVDKLKAEEKRMQSKHYQLSYEHTQLTEQKIQEHSFKESLIRFAIDQPQMDRATLKTSIQSLIQHIHYSKSTLEIQFRQLPFPTHQTITQHPPNPQK